MSLLKSTLLLGLIFISVKSISQQPAAHTFSVKDCIEYAMKNNVQVKNALLDIQVQKQDNRVTTAQALPSVNGSAGFTDNLKIPTQLLPGEFFGQPAGTYIPVQFGTQYSAMGSVTLQQTLFDGQVFVGLKARKTSIDYREKSLAVTQDMIKQNIYKIYYQLVVSKTQIQQIDANINRSKDLLRVNTALQKNGFGEQIEVDRTSVQLANFQTRKLSIESTIKNGYYGLKFLMGMPEKDSLVLTDSLSEDQLKQGLLNEGIYSYENRSDYQVLQSTVKLQEFNLKRYKLAFLPTVSLTGNYLRQGQGTEFNIFGKGQWFSSAYAALNLSVPLFNGFSKDANIKKAKFQLEQAQNQLEDLKNSIDNSTMQAVNTFHSAISTLDDQKRNVELAERVYQQSQKKYESGLGSLLDITNAQSDLSIAQSNYISAMYDAVIAKIDYLYATGQLQ
ncbi:TolC family protein [Parafilimonas terrae]|jgi:outer membrane protein TolC|uniref:Outer membrane protein TolC n=1 Tax=Parafilimonas terrae TaxID=1465490 RepID=A0A1I5WER2_9BACT|nr:TolC family protein [Parafilimonas terrae]SFQ18192.1 Outer membrane protein TolC [Parafilimonas terrae]